MVLELFNNPSFFKTGGGGGNDLMATSRTAAPAATEVVDEKEKTRVLNAKNMAARKAASKKLQFKLQLYNHYRNHHHDDVSSEEASTAATSVATMGGCASGEHSSSSLVSSNPKALPPSQQNQQQQSEKQDQEQHEIVFLPSLLQHEDSTCYGGGCEGLSRSSSRTVVTTVKGSPTPIPLNPRRALLQQVEEAIQTCTAQETELSDTVAFHVGRAQARLENDNPAGACLSMRKVKRLQRQQQRTVEAISYLWDIQRELEQLRGNAPMLLAQYQNYSQNVQDIISPPPPQLQQPSSPPLLERQSSSSLIFEVSDSTLLDELAELSRLQQHRQQQQQQQAY